MAENVARQVAVSMESVSGVSMREVATSIFIRWKLFLACALSVPLLVLLITNSVPPVYESAAKVLIQYDRTQGNLFSEIMSERQPISANSNAEIIQSAPICGKMAEDLQLTSADVARSATSIVIGRVLGWAVGLLPKEKEAADTGGANKQQALVNDLKAMIAVSVLRQERNVFDLRDEVLEVKMRSPSRLKVADMVNGLCKAFIDDYYRREEGDAKRAYECLVKETTAAAERVNELNSRMLSDAWSSDLKVYPAASKEGADKQIATNPLVMVVSQRIAEMEVRLAVLRQSFREETPEIERAKHELAAARNMMLQQEELEGVKLFYNTMKQKCNQAQLSLDLFKNRLLPIAVVEPALIPEKSKAAELVRYILNGLVGLFAGLVLGAALVLLLRLLDQRIYSNVDVEQISGVKNVGSLPPITDRKLEVNIFSALPPPQVHAGLMQAIGPIKLGTPGRGYMLLVTGVSAGEGKAFVAAQLANLLARDDNARILLVDGNFNNPALSASLGHAEKPGLIEVLGRSILADQAALPTDFPNLMFMPAGAVKKRRDLGFFRHSLEGMLDDLRKHFSVIVVLGSGLLRSTEAAFFAHEADGVIVVVHCGQTRQKAFHAAVSVLKEYEAHLVSIILNQRRYYVPRWLYGRL